MLCSLLPDSFRPLHPRPCWSVRGFRLDILGRFVPAGLLRCPFVCVLCPALARRFGGVFVVGKTNMKEFLEYVNIKIEKFFYFVVGNKKKKSPQNAGKKKTRRSGLDLSGGRRLFAAINPGG